MRSAASSSGGGQTSLGSEAGCVLSCCRMPGCLLRSGLLGLEDSQLPAQ